MKKLSLAVILLSTFLWSCDKKNAGPHYTGKAVITGRSLEKCACCWGWNIDINGHSYRFEKVPSTTTFDLENETFPLPVMIEWSESAGGCKGIIIDVLSISKY